ncbi:MAG TPA: YajQ family cyclic di-GMP-binding protein [Candidatus Omnitrophota bacterium]|nr:YajQ family cyclic di-GMP-binding protein [Candidatus Omnitrophota bacterium]HPS37083.1 YajQ family cyclic di-GMP-binding protein [Candidatus Omnitrophota bacterium]
MAQQFSFDVVSQLDLQEVDNAVNQAKKELQTRFDFKGSKGSVEFLKDEKEKKIRLIADDDMKLRNLQDILKTRMVSRKISVKSLDFKTPEKAFDGCLRQEVSLVQGLPQEKSKEIVKAIKDMNLKVQTAIQGEEVRISSKSKDELQAVIQHLRALPLTVPIQFVNFR